MSNEKGFLSKVDRDFLTGEKEYTGENAKQQRYERREAIAARTRQAFRDFSLLYEILDENERNRIFDVGDSPTDFGPLNEIGDALTDTIAFMYLATEGELGSSTIYRRSFRTPFEAILKTGVAKAEVDRRPDNLPDAIVNVPFGVETSRLDPTDIDRAIEKIAEGRKHELTEVESRQLIAAFDPDTGTHEGGWGALTEQVQERRAELKEDWF